MHRRRTKPELGLILTKIYLHDVHSAIRRHQTSPEPSVCVSLTLSRHNAYVWAMASSLYKPTTRNSEPSWNESVQSFSQDKTGFTPFWFPTFPHYLLGLCRLTFPSSEWNWTEMPGLIHRSRKAQTAHNTPDQICRLTHFPKHLKYLVANSNLPSKPFIQDFLEMTKLFRIPSNPLFWEVEKLGK